MKDAFPGRGYLSVVSNGPDRKRILKDDNYPQKKQGRILES